MRTGALNTVQAGQVVFIEFTADGQEGHFFERCEAAQAKQRMGMPLTPLDFKFFFYPWWRCADYQIDPDGVMIERLHLVNILRQAPRHCRHRAHAGSEGLVPGRTIQKS